MCCLRKTVDYNECMTFRRWKVSKEVECNVGPGSSRCRQRLEKAQWLVLALIGSYSVLTWDKLKQTL